jgi:hypothetical protein
MYGLFVGALTILSHSSCASSTWREGFSGSDQLYLVGEGRAREDLPQAQRLAMAREAAIMDAMSHFPRYCKVLSNDNAVSSFRIENQKQRQVECDATTCRARIVIEKSGLREKCTS